MYQVDTLIKNITPDDLEGLIAKGVAKALQTNGGLNQAKSPKTTMLTVAEVCKLLQKGRTTIHRWRKSGILPYYRVKQSILFKEQEVLDAMHSIDNKERRI